MKNTLLIIPCCKIKRTNGYPKPSDYRDPLSKLIDEDIYQDIIKTRKTLSHIIEEEDSEYFSPAIERYIGYFYQAVPNLAQILKEKTNAENQPKLLILSALYGPLHLESLICNYDLLLNKKDSPWAARFVPFLENYVLRNDIKEVRIYCESDYADLLWGAIEPLRKRGILLNAIQYKVQADGAEIIYTNQGLQLIKDLEPTHPKLNFTREITARQL